MTSSLPRVHVPDSALSVLVVDDQRAVRIGVARLLQTMQPRPTVHLAADGAEALAALACHAPSVVVLDIDLAGDDGFALLPVLARRARVLVLTSHGDATTRGRAATLGAVAFVDKAASGVTLLRSFAALLAWPEDVVSGNSDSVATSGHPFAGGSTSRLDLVGKSLSSKDLGF